MKAERKKRESGDNTVAGQTGNVSETTSHERSARVRVAHIVMNLPETAIEFLDALRGVLSDRNLRGLYDTMPMVHCHCFTRYLDPVEAEADIVKVCGFKLSADISPLTGRQCI